MSEENNQKDIVGNDRFYEKISLDAAYNSVLGGVMAISPELYTKALHQIAVLCQCPVDYNFIEKVKAYEKTLPCDLD